MSHISIVVIGAIYRNGTFLLTFRNEKSPDHRYNQKWQLPGGTLEFGESPEDAVVRELKEEIGVDAKVIQLVPTLYSEVSKNWQGIFMCYICSIEDTAVITLNCEASDWGWYSPGEIQSLPLIPGTLSMVKDALLLVKNKCPGRGSDPHDLTVTGF